jgi:hypothetical protein
MATTFLNRIEYEEIPPPADVWRATKHAYAKDLIEDGLLFLTNTDIYRNDPDPERGDSTETDGTFIRNGVRCKTGHTNPIFLWCTTLESDTKAVLASWSDCDTVVRISNPEQFAQRIVNASKAQGVEGISFHCGKPTYDKNRGGTSPYHWSESIYQKPERYAIQKEYRFALVAGYSMIGVERIKLHLGPCSDLVSIVDTRHANKAMESDA